MMESLAKGRELSGLCNRQTELGATAMRLSFEGNSGLIQIT